MKKYILWGSLIASLLLGLVVYQYARFHDGKLHVIFCNVGQGDAILIKTPQQQIFLVDGGPDTSVVGCLGRHLPFWQRDITMLFLTHPHADHFFGFFTILEQFQVKGFASIQLRNSTTPHQELLKQLSLKQVPQSVLHPGDTLRLSNINLRVVGPSDAYLQQMTPDGTINHCDACPSLAIELTYGTFAILLTGDSEDLEFAEIVPLLSTQIDVMQIPHHGSSTGITASILEEINPRFAVISVGHQNRYNHPHPLILNLLSSHQIPYRRTDLAGDVEIVSDGERWRVEE